jgi:predicted DNA-binding transcriptional regulator AlpA
MQTSSDSDALIERYLGGRYLGRRYLRYAELEALGICDNRDSLNNWMRAGGFPRSIKIPSRYGKTLVWDALEVAQHIAQRCAEREIASPDNDEGAPSRERPL